MSIRWKENEDGLKLIIEKPENMNLAKWEKTIIKIAKNLSELGVKIRRISDKG